MSVGKDYWNARWRQIAPNHYQSGFPIPFTDLPKHGVDLVVLCARELQPDADDVAFIRSQCPNLGIIRAPFDDVEVKSELPEILRIADPVAERVAQHLQEGKRVLVTCAVGRNRSGLVSALTLCKRYGMSGHDAVLQVRGADGGNRLALSNRMFAAYLETVPAR